MLRMKKIPKLREKKRNIENVREYRQNLEGHTTEITNDANLITVKEDDSIIKPFERNKPVGYLRFVKNVGEHSKKTDKGWFSNLLGGQNQEEEKLEIFFEANAIEAKLNLDKKIIIIILHNLACCYQKLKDYM